MTEPRVEFFDPNIRAVLERRDAEIIKKTGRGAAPGGDEWVWMTDGSRVPVSLLQPEASSCQINSIKKKRSFNDLNSAGFYVCMSVLLCACFRSYQSLNVFDFFFKSFQHLHI